MSGIWELVKPNSIEDNSPRVNRLQTVEVMAAYVLGLATGAEAKDIVEASLGRPLDGNEIVDLVAITATLDAGNTTAKLSQLHRIKAAFMLAETGTFDEARFRAAIGIV